MSRHVGMQPLVLLDTNVLIHIARADPVGTWVVENYRLARHSERPLISTVVEAEVRALAAYQGWGERKLDRVRDIIGECVRVEIDRPPVVDAYVDLYCIARSEGRANWQKNQNDLWLAATAKATDAMLLTQDEDFDFLHPEHVRIERVPKEVP